MFYCSNFSFWVVHPEIVASEVLGYKTKLETESFDIQDSK